MEHKEQESGGKLLVIGVMNTRSGMQSTVSSTYQCQAQEAG